MKITADVYLDKETLNNAYEQHGITSAEYVPNQPLFLKIDQTTLPKVGWDDIIRDRKTKNIQIMEGKYYGSTNFKGKLR